MARFRPWPVTALVAWTWFTWGTRIPLLLKTSSSTDQTVVGSLSIAAFAVLATVAGVAVYRSDDGVLVGWARTAALVLAGWSIAYWVLRLPFILANDHPGPFKVVHSVLAAVAVGLSAWALRHVLAARPAVRRPDLAST